MEQTYVDEGALVKVLDEYDEADERTLPVSLLSDEEVGLLHWLLAIPFNVQPSCDVRNQDVKVHVGYWWQRSRFAMVTPEDSHASGILEVCCLLVCH